MQDNTEINIVVNGEPRKLKVGLGETLLDVLRNIEEKKGVKQGCEAEGCGACTVMVDSQNVYSCMYSAILADGHSITTIEGLGSEQELDGIQYEFMKEWAFQCGYCTPGFIMAIKSMEADLKVDPGLINSKWKGDIDAYIRDGLTGHICRCTGYLPIHQAARNRLDEVRGSSAETQ